MLQKLWPGVQLYAPGYKRWPGRFHIARCQASGSYTIIFTENEKILTSRNIKEYEDLLPDSIFCRIHNSHIVNLNAVKKYYKGRGGHIEMNDGTVIEVAIRRKDIFLQKFKR